MRLATLCDGTRDGALAVVARDLSKAVMAETTVAGLRTLQQLMDDWPSTYLKVERIYAELNEVVDGRRAAPFAMVDFDAARCAAPLPRAFQWADGSAYVNHVELVRRARGAEMPQSFWTDPLMYQGGSDSFLGPRDPILMADEDWGIDMEAEIAVITDDVPTGVPPQDAKGHVRLIMLVNDVSLRNLISAELAKGFGFFQSKPSSSCSPVAVTPEELGQRWDQGKLHGILNVDINGEAFGRAHAGEDMTFDFGALIAHAAK